MFKEIRTGEILIYTLPLLLAIAIFGLCYLLYSNCIDITTFYSEKMRGSLFAGFLTLGSFLLALKTGIVIKIKEGVYDKPDYQKKVLEIPELKGKISVYGPLRRLSRVLSVAVLSALITSALQLTLGLFNDWRATAVCLSFATFAMSTLIASFILIQMNLATWFDLMEEGVIPPDAKK